MRIFFNIIQDSLTLDTCCFVICFASWQYLYWFVPHYIMFNFFFSENLILFIYIFYLDFLLHILNS